MNGYWTRSLWAAALVVGISASAAVAHHGWSEYDEKTPLTIDGIVKSATYSNPHGTMKFEAAGKVWDVVLAPVARMQTRGLTEAMLRPGTEVRVVGYQHRKTATEMRAENVTIGGKKVELR
jgi:hypothetical protein